MLHSCEIIFRMAFILHQSPVFHGHSHDHNNTSVRAAFIHVLGDLLQSLGVLLAAIIIYFWVSDHLVKPLYQCDPLYLIRAIISFSPRSLNGK